MHFYCTSVISSTDSRHEVWKGIKNEICSKKGVTKQVFISGQTLIGKDSETLNKKQKFT
jgi:hypothetical protein